MGDQKKGNYQNPPARSIRKETVFPVIKKVIEEASSEKVDRPPKELKTDLEFHCHKSHETLKILKVIYENKRLKISFLDTIIVYYFETGVDIKTLLHSINLTTLQMIQTIS